MPANGTAPRTVPYSPRLARSCPMQQHQAAAATAPATAAGHHHHHHHHNHHHGYEDGKLLVKCAAVWALGMGIAVVSGPWADAIGFELLRSLELKVGTSAMRESRSSWWDAGHTFLPHVYAPWLADTVLLSVLVSVAMALAYRTHGSRVRRLATLLSVHGCVLLLRSAAIFSTVSMVSPVVAARLRAGESLDSIEGHVGFVANTNCFDMMFSGHASTSIVCACFIATSMLPLALKLPMVLVAVFSAVLQVLVGDHYSNDVVVGCYTAAMVFALHWPLISATSPTTPPAASTSSATATSIPAPAINSTSASATTQREHIHAD